MLKAIIFDMDGVLVNSVPHIWNSFRLLLKDYNVSFSEEYIKKNLARSLRDNLKEWKKEFGIPEFNLKEFSKETTRVQMDFLKEEVADLDLVSFLTKTKEEGILLAVATSSHRLRAIKILTHLNLLDYFPVLVGAEDVEKHKPDPAVFLEAARRLDVKPEECIVIEDAGNGIDAAKNGGMKAIGRLTAFHSREELGHADLIIEDFSELNLKKVRQLFE